MYIIIGIFIGFSFIAHPANTEIQYTALNFKTKQYIKDVSQLWDMTLLYSFMSEFLFYTFSFALLDCISSEINNKTFLSYLIYFVFLSIFSTWNIIQTIRNIWDV